MKTKTTLSMLILFLTAPLLMAHGIQLSAGQKYPCVFVKAEYPGGYAIAFAEASTIFQNENKQYQKGGTDKNGVYSFCPDKTGEWTVTIDDGMGHKDSIKISITKEFFNISKSSRESTADGKNKALTAKNAVADLNKNNPVNTPQPNEKKKKPLEKSALCCYLLKVLMGVLLILLITFLLHRLAKKGEKTG